MESFFARMEPWRKPEGSLHLYVLPNEQETARFAAAQDAVSGIDNLPLMPEAYLHCTVQRLAQFDDEVAQSQFTLLGNALENFCSGVPSFNLQFKAPRADDVAVGCWAADSPHWDALVKGCRQVVIDTWGVAPASPPAAPHLSLAYATGSVPHGLITSRLADVEPLGEVHVSKLHLVSVTVRPERGTFDFTSLANWDLASTS